MRKHVLNYCSRTTLICIEVLAVLTGLLVLCGGLLVWRLMNGPLDVNFAKTHSKDALHRPESGYSGTLGNVNIEWPDMRGPVMLDLQDITLTKNDQSVVDIGGAGIGLSTRFLMVGRIAPTSIVLDSPNLHLIRTENNNIKLDAVGDTVL